jgi:uncharacterized protein (TIGR00303 family)
MRFLLVGGSTATAGIDGISAAGADEELMAHTPSADLEVVTYGRTVRAPTVPVSPSGCPTPAVVTRAVRDLLGFDVVPVDGGLARPTGAPTVDVGAAPGTDVREAEPVAAADGVFEAARTLAASLPADDLVVGETIPGGTTTALGVLVALGERPSVSSSLPDNPLELKQEVVSAGLEASDLSRGGCAGDPVAAVRQMGDPVLAVVTGLVVGATQTGSTVTLAGGTQMVAAAALARHAGVDAPVVLATTSFVADDEAAAIDDLADDLDLSLRVTDPGFDGLNHPAADAYEAGEAKEGVGMGGALALADDAVVSMSAVRQRVVSVYDALVAGDGPG